MTSDFLTSMAFFVAYYLLILILHLTPMALTGIVFWARFEEYSIGFGPKIFSFEIGRTKFSIRAILFGGFVKFDDSIKEVHPLKQIIIMLSGCITLVLLAVLVLGVDGFGYIGRGFYQSFYPLISPSVKGAGLISNLFMMIRELTALQMIAIIAAKVAAYNLLPFPHLNGGHAIITFLDWAMGLSEKTKDRLSTIGMIAMFLMMLSWILAFGIFAVRQI